MTPTLRTAGFPSPIEAATHDDSDLRAPIAFDPDAAGTPEVPANADRPISVTGSLEMTDGEYLDAMAVQDDGALPGWLTAGVRMIRPICVGALMAIPTMGAATIGTVALFDEQRGVGMARASVAFLVGLPTDIILLIGTLATGYSVSKTVERIKGVRR